MKTMFLYSMRGLWASMDKDAQIEVTQCVERIKSELKNFDPFLGGFAVAIINAENESAMEEANIAHANGKAKKKTKPR